MEICVDSVQSAVNAECGGADRLELCSALGLGGLTPSLGLLKVVKGTVKIPVFVLIRPRPGDFLYDDAEVEIMKQDIIASKENGANGIVVGALKKDGSVDAELCRTLVDLSRPLPLTFHRAIDMSRDPLAELNTVAALGFSRVLSSGACASALQGVSLLAQMVHHASGITVMPGGGITDKNLAHILRETQAVEFHCSAKHNVNSGMVFRQGDVSMGVGSAGHSGEYSLCITDERAVTSMRRIAEEIWTATN